ncbi:HAD-IIB family hydrolase [Achromobacter xylosoxidans]|uniref:HAD-IIB family hydrolase n=1 Tax=Alcaligenes xylosoxydans xylosoxydans TaxID=85698 RepID=UPI00292F1252|nr:HAD-IIB family hydrolase [Achromobacter xylosoxidans]WOB72954.1 HAD-IIB family hydrolase [Achromobacter xylosoxidans]
MNDDGKSPALSHYEEELAELRHSYAAASAADIVPLKLAIASTAEASMIGVGSGGSFTVASLLCSFHETYTGRVSRPSTPLEIICSPALASSSPVFLISAEGKNPDIVEALERARRFSSRTVHVLTNRQDSPLMQHVQALPGVKPYVFELAKKDGYLATNSLLLDAVLVARAYGELNGRPEPMPPDMSALRVGDQTVDDWLADAQPFIEESVRRGALTVVYSPLLRSIATDLESKLSEGALLHTQLADLRSYAHGRHLWLAQRPEECAILALVEPSLSPLWEGMRDKFPAGIPTLTMPLAGSDPVHLIAGLVAQMHLVAAVGRQLGKDPGRPDVPSYGREIHYANLRDVIPLPEAAGPAEVQSKYEVLGAHWPSQRDHGTMRRAAQTFRDVIQAQRFRAIVFDYDGTLCNSQSTDAPPSAEVVAELVRLVRAGVLVGIASGRGDSLQDRLREALPEDVLKRIRLCLYNGGWINAAEVAPVLPNQTSEFLSHVTRIVVRLKSLGVPILAHKTTPPFQVSVRFREGLATDAMWFVIADALRQAGLDLSTMVRSKHSVDILANGVSKSRLIASIIQNDKIDPYEILTMGDQGAWPGNDAALLEHRFSLSVDMPSRRLDRGWKLAPPEKRDVDATLWYLAHIQVADEGVFNLALPPATNIGG